MRLKKFDQTDAKLEEQKEAVRALKELGRAKPEIFVRDIQTSLLNAGGEKSNFLKTMAYHRLGL